MTPNVSVFVHFGQIEVHHSIQTMRSELFNFPLTPCILIKNIVIFQIILGSPLETIFENFLVVWFCLELCFSSSMLHARV